MALKHTVTTSVRSDAGGGVSDSTVFSSDTEQNIASVATAGDTLELDFPLDVSQIISMYIWSSEDLSLLTNSAISPTQTIPLTAKKAVWWNTDQDAACPLTADVTSFHFVNTLGANDATIKCGFLLDSTP